MQEIRRRAVVLLALAVLCGSALHAATLVQKMDLAEVCSRADKIFRGTVVSATPGEIEVGGGTLPIITYQIKVSEAFQGDYVTKGDERVTEIKMLAPQKSRDLGERRHFSALADLPTLAVGGDYLLMTSRPSAIGLSTPVGLAQGCYEVKGKGDAQIAVNAVGESFAYRELARAIRAAVTQ